MANDLLPDDLKERLLNAPEDSTVALAHYFSPITGWEWYAVSARMVGNDPVFFGYVKGDFDEWGEFDLDILDIMDAQLDRKHEEVKL